jgi:hypothetical protein
VCRPVCSNDDCPAGRTDNLGQSTGSRRHRTRDRYRRSGGSHWSDAGVGFRHSTMTAGTCCRRSSDCSGSRLALSRKADSCRTSFLAFALDRLRFGRPDRSSRDEALGDRLVESVHRSGCKGPSRLSWDSFRHRCGVDPRNEERQA